MVQKEPCFLLSPDKQTDVYHPTLVGCQIFSRTAMSFFILFLFFGKRFAMSFLLRWPELRPNQPLRWFAQRQQRCLGRGRARSRPLWHVRTHGPPVNLE
jgi:hypothetical protein